MAISTAWIIVFFAFSVVSTKIYRAGLQQFSKQHGALFIFGDSIFDAGNNNYIITNTTFQANYWPYSETFFRFPTGRFSDGRLIPDFIAEYADLPLIPPYLHPDTKNYLNGVNFASAGAGALVETFQGFVLDLKTQLSFFNIVEGKLTKQLGNEKAKAFLSKAVYFICIGSNDYIDLFITNSTLFQSQSPKEYVDFVIGNLTTAIKRIHNKGGRKFAFLNIGPLGCIPSVKAELLQGKDGCYEEMTQFAKLHNQRLSKALQKLEKKLNGFVYSYADFYAAFYEITSSPAKYGIKGIEGGMLWQWSIQRTGKLWREEGDKRISVM